VDYAWLLPLIFGVMFGVGAVGFVVVARKRADLDREERAGRAPRRGEGEGNNL
jgi:hypothetical protein